LTLALEMTYILLGETVLCKVLELLRRSVGSNIDSKIRCWARSFSIQIYEEKPHGN